MTWPALGAGAALAAMIFASRLPPTLDFILPRRAGWALYSGAFDLLSRPGARTAFSAAAVLLLLASAGLFLRRALAAARWRTWSPRERLARAWGLLLALALARWSFVVWLEVSQRVWFPFGSLDPLEPAANLAACGGILWLAGRACLGFLAPKRASLSDALAGWAAGTALAAAAAAVAYGAWTPPPAPAAAAWSAGAPRLRVLVLTEEEGRPSRTVYDLPAPSAEAVLAAAEERAARPGVHRLALLRALYSERAKLMDPEGLRRALSLGARLGDDLARSLLLAHLASAPPTAAGRAALDALADETAHRVGPAGAARLALAYARFGDGARAAYWARESAASPRGVPEGLLDLSGEVPSNPGRIAGRVLGDRPARVALYRREGPGAPYLLDAAALAAAAAPAPDGRFAFAGLRPGRYYLAFAFDPATARAGELRVSGHRGDVVLDGRRGAAELVLTIVSAGAAR
ncbi:MAG: hypothetical protein M0D55_17960 [Elusimicrobiota bacterium]|nr:MAG: hypothetical protein M0D55_17960 [Elusimicrobiota bacterium]